MKFRVLILIVLAALACQFGCRRDFSGKKQPQAQRGVLDLRAWDFRRDGSTKLDGRWAFYWKQLLKDVSGKEPHAYAQVPKPWKGIRAAGEVVGGAGYATYHLLVLLPKNTAGNPGDFLAMELGDINTAYRLYVNGRLLHSAGEVGRDEASSRPEFRPDIVPLAASERLSIIVQVANFHHRKGGLDHAIRLGREKDVRAGHEAANNVSLFVFGSLLFLGLYHFVLFMLRRTDARPLDLALVCVVLGVRSLATGNYFIMRMIPELPFSVLLKIEYLTLVITVPIFAKFVRSLFPREFSRWTLLFFQVIGGAWGLVILATDVSFFSQTLIYYFAVLFIFIAFAFGGALLAFFRKRDGAGFVLVGGFIFMVTAIVDVLNNQYIVRFLPNASPYGLLCFVFLHSFLLARGSARAFATAEQLSSDLEERVAARTRELQASHNAIRLSEQKYRNLVETSSDLIWSLDAEGRLTFVNQAAIKIYGLEPDELLGRELVELSAPEFAARDTEVFNMVLRGRSYFHYETVHLHKDGRPIQMSFNAIFLYDAKGEIVGATGTATDITEYKRVLEELERARDTAEQANRAKSEFLATMSHEIRTPLNSIIGTANLLRDTSHGEEQGRYIEILNRAGKNLLNQINDILDISRIEAGKMDLENIGFYLSDLMESIISVMRIRAEEKGISIELNIHPDLPPRVAGDPARLEQILMNLIGNAVKFTEQGVIAVNVEPAEETAGVAALRFSVADTGIGIPREKLEHIFGSFSQVDSSTTRQYGGTGLGLAICRQLVNLMGGRLWVHSDGASSSLMPGEAAPAKGPGSPASDGSVFYFTARFGRVDQGAGVFAGVKSPTLAKEGVLASADNHGGSVEDLPSDFTVLLVEDNPDNLFLFRNYLEKAGISLETAENGRVAVEKSAARSFHMILMDIQMPVMDGYRATELIREREKREGSQPVPILALTANATRSDMEKTNRLGFNAHVSKPVSRDNLLKAIARYGTVRP